MEKDIRLDSITAINTNLLKLSDPINFAMGDISPSISQQQRFREFIANSLERPMGYTPVLGEPAAREAVAEFFNQRERISITEANVAITSGAIHGLFMVLNVITRENGEVLVADPSWSAYDFPVRANGLWLRKVDFELDNIDQSDILKHINKDTIAIIINNPENPTGRIYPYNNLVKFIEKIASTPTHPWIILDEVYIDLVYKEDHPQSLISQLKKEPKLIVISSLSKSCALTGWRLGFILAREDFIKQIEKSIRATISCVPRLCQKALVHTLENFNYYNGLVIKLLKKRRDLLCEFLQSVKSVEFTLPEAGIYVWLDISKISRNTKKVTEELFFKKEVGVVPGYFFGPKGENFIRLSFGYEDEKRIRIGAERFISYLLNQTARDKRNQ